MCGRAPRLPECYRRRRPLVEAPTGSDGNDATMAVHDRVEINPKIMLGKAVIRGTRIPIELIVRKLAEGADEKALLQAYPRLTAADIQAALRYAADSLAHEEVLLTAAG